MTFKYNDISPDAIKGMAMTYVNTEDITIDASGEVTKIGQDTPSDTQVLTWDNGNSKVVWSAAAGGAATNDVDALLHQQVFS